MWKMKHTIISIRRVLLHGSVFLLITGLCFLAMSVYKGHGLPNPRLTARMIGWVPVGYLFFVWALSKYRKRKKTGP